MPDDGLSDNAGDLEVLGSRVTTARCKGGPGRIDVALRQRNAERNNAAKQSYEQNEPSSQST